MIKPVKSEDILKALSGNTDFKSRFIKTENGGIISVFYIEGMVDSFALSRFIIEKLRMINSIRDAVFDGRISFCDVDEVQDTKSAVLGILRGKAAVIYNDEAYMFDIRKTVKRAVEQPSEESAVKASKDCFNEELKVNTTLIRKKIVSPSLKMEQMIIGKQTNTAVVIAYMENIASDKLIREVKEKLKKINNDGIITPGVVEQYLKNNVFSLFPQAIITERPDKVARNLLNGRCAVIVDGLPIAYILPATVSQLMSTPEDYSGNFIFASVVRLLRYFLLSVEVLLPGAYVALTTFHYEMLPSKLALSIAQAKMGVPFPVVFEILAMLALFEVLVEAGLHMPKSSGQAVSIVGALVVGEAAISADLVSPAALIVVAVSAISSFAMPNQEFSNGLRLCRLIITVCGGVLGLFGVVAGGIVLLAHLASLESFGVPYLAPFAGVKKIRIKDALIVVPDKFNTHRPNELNVKNKRRSK
jgi:spore germination protein KA